MGDAPARRASVSPPPRQGSAGDLTEVPPGLSLFGSRSKPAGQAHPPLVTRPPSQTVLSAVMRPGETESWPDCAFAGNGVRNIKKIEIAATAENRVILKPRR